MASLKTHLLIIDPQNDFCDIPEALLPFDQLAIAERIARGLVPFDPADLPARIKPALAVPGAHADMLRLAAMIDRIAAKLDDIHVTEDAHHPVDIAHPVLWRNAAGDYPAPFTIISEDDVNNEVWYARNPKMRAYFREYVRKLREKGRYQLIIWPEHCLIGSWGHAIHANVAAALNRWARSKLAVVDYVTKGSNPLTEHYSAAQAEVPDPADPSTTLNGALVNTLSRADIILVAGEALSHCVASTVRDIAREFGEDNIKKFVLLTDCCSSVGGFENLGSDFIREMTARGMKVAKSTEIFA